MKNLCAIGAVTSFTASATLPFFCSREILQPGGVACSFSYVIFAIAVIFTYYWLSER